MALTTIITDGSGINGSATVLKKHDLSPGLVVYSEPLRNVIAQTKAATNTTYGVDMNKDGRYTGTPDGIHDGTDSVLWTATNIVGTNFVFDSTAQAQAGTKSIDTTATTNNNEMLLTRGSTISSGSYVALTGYIYITGWGASTDIRFIVRNSGTVLSTTINLSNYISTGVLNSWQKFSIPMSAFAMGTVNFNQIVIRSISGGSTAPNAYLDTLQWEETTGSATYVVEPDNGSIYTITDLSITMADAYDTTLANNSVPKILYNQLLGVTALTTGLQFRLTTGQVIRFNAFFKQHIDFMTFPGVQFSSGGDATNTWINYQVHFSTPFVMDARTEDKLEILLTEDLSGLLFFKVLVRGHKEEIM
jgi:hypothetical protein